MTENRETIKAGSVFITQRTREVIHKIAEERSEEELKECFMMLHDSMDRFGKQIAVEEITGKDFVIYTPERRIAKTEAPLRELKAAAEYVAAWQQAKIAELQKDAYIEARRQQEKIKEENEKKENFGIETNTDLKKFTN